MQNDIVLQIAKVTRRELDQWRESMTYYEIEAFVGSLLADLLEAKIITGWEESILRERILG